MSKRDYIIRFLLIIKKLRNSKFATFNEINDYIEREFDIMDSPKNISLRTFQRDLNEIRSIFNIDIHCNNLNQYYIEEDEHSGFNNRMMEAFDIFNSLSTGQQLTPFVLLEKRCSLGTEHIYGLLHAIKNRLVVRMDYQKFYETNQTTREVEPYALKEFKGRWYLLCKDFKDNYTKTFALDRIHGLEITKKKYNYPANLNPNDYFENCYGIITSDDSDPEEIVLSFEPFQGKYIKSYPLHESQKILIDNETELRISLYLYETHDLLMELLSYGANLQVIQPKSLIDKMTGVVKDMYKIYNTEKNKT
ncbi:MAG: WYL domain-containing protein [Bacteroidota bacterium]|nr:MAG: WYL domain-containing protein [Bacteroidota bacterium]